MTGIYQQLADLLEYPNTKLDPKVTTESAQVASFGSYIATLTLSELQELYTRTFDLNPACALEVGYHLFGENYKRGEFLANLRATEAPFELGQAQQLPDYLPVLLRLLPKLEDQELRSSLITECLIPAIEKMLGTFKDAANPYRSLLETLRIKLQGEPSAQPAALNRSAFHGMSLPVIQPARFAGSASEHVLE
jgi:nitrate reductase delta subunit